MKTFISFRVENRIELGANYYYYYYNGQVLVMKEEEINKKREREENGEPTNNFQDSHSLWKKVEEGTEKIQRQCVSS